MVNKNYQPTWKINCQKNPTCPFKWIIYIVNVIDNWLFFPIFVYINKNKKIFKILLVEFEKDSKPGNESEDSILRDDEKNGNEVVDSVMTGVFELVSFWVDVDSKLKYRPNERPSKIQKKTKVDAIILERFVLKK